MDFGSLFSGIEGFGLGLERAGMRCRWQVEIDPYCQAVLRKHWPDVPKYCDIKALTGDELEPVDLVCGGFPCQPVSLAGQRQRIADDRWLWPEFARLLRVLRPRYVLVENVPGLLVGGGMGEVLGDLAALGFDAEWECIPAAVVGAPHLRYRLFIVAHAHGSGRSNPERGSGPDKTGGRVLATNLAELGRAEWLSEPSVGRVVDGLSADVDAVRALGNAVVPQVAEAIGRALMERAA